MADRLDAPTSGSPSYGSDIVPRPAVRANYKRRFPAFLHRHQNSNPTEEAPVFFGIAVDRATSLLVPQILN